MIDGKTDTHVGLRGIQVRQTEIGARLTAVRGPATQEAFAADLEVAVKTLRRYEQGERDPDLTFLSTLLQKKGISTDWLLTGRGSKQPTTVSDERGTYEFELVPLYDVKAAAGSGSLVVDERIMDTLAFRPDFLRHELAAGKDDLYLIHVEGDSMEPTLRGGDVILVDHRRKTADREGIYVIRMGDALLVKRLHVQPGGVIVATSDNPFYKPFEVDLKATDTGVAIIGRVVWAGRRF